MSESAESPDRGQSEFRAEDMTRPASVLLKYYVLCSLFAGPFFPFALIPLFCKYVTLRYRFDDSGIAMSWGVLFRREIQLTYRRIQDIHLSRNIIQRWLGLATLSVQTASGSATPEMSIEGILEAERLRDHLYAKMRGAKGDLTAGTGDEPSRSDQAIVLLSEIRDSMRTLAEKSVAPGGEATHD